MLSFSWAKSQGGEHLLRSMLSIGGVWELHAPRVGWLCFVKHEGVLSAHKAAGWSVGVAS